MFKDIIGYEGLYQISDKGSVKSMARKPSYKGESYLQERMLKQEIIKRKHTNYRRVSLSKNGIVIKFQVHQLVGKAFIANLKNKPHINHIDNDGENNWINNLEWCTHSENMLHAQKQGRLDNSIINANKKRIQNQQLKHEEYFKKLLGNRFIELLPSRRTMITFRCEGCEKKYSARIDSSLFKHDQIRCKKCKGR